MRRVMATLQKRTAEYAREPLFQFLQDTSIPAAKRLSFAPCVAHFVMSFADLYADVLFEEPTQDKYQQLVNTHTKEDENHFRWFLADLEKLGADPQVRFSDALRFVWGTHTRQMRLLSYHMCRLGFRVEPLQKLVLVQCIEGAGKVTVDNVAKVGREFCQQTGARLVYFGPHHSETESEHTLEGNETRRMIENIELESHVAERYSTIVDEAFQYFSAFSSEMLDFARSGKALGASRS
jgi:hypothetical protein